MRHIKNYKELFEAQMELSQEQIGWLNKCAKKRWTLNPKTGLVDVEEKFDCSGQKLTDFKGVRFGKVTGDFSCHNNRITSLEGAPQKVGGSFYCYSNRLTSLEGAPRKVGGLFTCSDNLLTSLEGAPQSVGGNFWCNSSLLTSLEGAPQKVGGSLYGKDNPVSEETLVDLYRKMGSGRSWPDAVASYWERIRKEEDKILLAQYNPKLSPEEIKRYQALAKFRNKII
jgi:hypothetical protein